MTIHIYNTDRIDYILFMTRDSQTSTHTHAPRGAPRSKRSHAAILDAALQLADSGGPQALSIEAVARRAGVGKQTIYRWWPNRMELLFEVYDRYAPALQDLDSDLPLPDVLKTLFETYRSGPAGELLAALIALSRDSAENRALFQAKFVIPRQGALARYLTKSGYVPEAQAENAAATEVALIWYALLNDPPLLDDAYIDKICTLVQTPLHQGTQDRITDTFEIKNGYVPGYSARLVDLHMNYYSATWGFGRNFESLLARDFGQMLDSYDPHRDQLIRLENAYGQIVGTLVIEANCHPQDTARVRFFVLSPSAKGRGLGRQMLDQALNVCKARGQTNVYLTTFRGLDAARTLYERAGFVLTEETSDDEWGEGTGEVRYDLVLD